MRLKNEVMHITISSSIDISLGSSEQVVMGLIPTGTTKINRTFQFQNSISHRRQNVKQHRTYYVTTILRQIQQSYMLD